MVPYETGVINGILKPFVLPNIRAAGKLVFGRLVTHGGRMLRSLGSKLSGRQAIYSNVMIHSSGLDLGEISICHIGNT